MDARSCTRSPTGRWPSRLPAVADGVLPLEAAHHQGIVHREREAGQRAPRRRRQREGRRLRDRDLARCNRDRPPGRRWARRPTPCPNASEACPPPPPATSTLLRGGALRGCRRHATVHRRRTRRAPGTRWSAGATVRSTATTRPRPGPGGGDRAGAGGRPGRAFRGRGHDAGRGSPARRPGVRRRRPSRSRRTKRRPQPSWRDPRHLGVSLTAASAARRRRVVPCCAAIACAGVGDGDRGDGRGPRDRGGGTAGAWRGPSGEHDQHDDDRRDADDGAGWPRRRCRWRRAGADLARVASARGADEAVSRARIAVVAFVGLAGFLGACGGAGPAVSD